MKRPYEITVVVRILANEEETQGAIDQITGWIEQPDATGEPQGKVSRVDRTTLGRRKLAYEIDRQRDGIFMIYFANVEPKHITELELNLKLSQSVLRHLVVRLEEEIPAKVTEQPVVVAAEPVVVAAEPVVVAAEPVVVAAEPVVVAAEPVAVAAEPVVEAPATVAVEQAAE